LFLLEVVCFEGFDLALEFFGFGSALVRLDAERVHFLMKISESRGRHLEEAGYRRDGCGREDEFAMRKTKMEDGEVEDNEVKTRGSMTMTRQKSRDVVTVTPVSM